MGCNKIKKPPEKAVSAEAGVLPVQFIGIRFNKTNRLFICIL